MSLPNKSSDETLVMISSTGLRRALEKSEGPFTFAANGVEATAAQLETAARLISEAEPSVITKVNGGRVINPAEHECPAFVDSEQQLGDGSLLLNLGIIPRTDYVIEADGSVRP